MINNKDIIESVQYNCNIADSRSASNYTLCIYLLKMREYYRWEKNLAFNEALPKEDIGNWISAREQLWNDLDSRDYADIEINNNRYSPFDSSGINNALIPHNLIYSGGIGLNGGPHFFIAELISRTSVDEQNIFVSGKELARDLTAPPAMSHEKTIYIRRESLRRMIWERLEEWRWKGAENALSRAFQYHDLDNSLEDSLDRMTEQESDVLLYHEIGEIQAGLQLGEQWHSMLSILPRSAGEFMVRAIRDHIADCCSTLPMLIEMQRHASLHFYFGNFNAMRREIFPSLYSAYDEWNVNGNDEELFSIAKKGAQHWSGVAQQVLSLFEQYQTDCLEHIVALVEENKL